MTLTFDLQTQGHTFYNEIQAFMVVFSCNGVLYFLEPEYNIETDAEV